MRGENDIILIIVRKKKLPVNIKRCDIFWPLECGIFKLVGPISILIKEVSLYLITDPYRSLFAEWICSSNMLFVLPYIIKFIQ